MIKSFKDKRLEAFFRNGVTKGIDKTHLPRIENQLAALDAATGPNDLNVRSWKLHELVGNRRGTFSMTVQKNWRLTFEFDGPDVVLLDYEDYH